MIGQRTRGLQSTLLLCQILLVPLLLLVSGLLAFTSVTSIEGSLIAHYPMYAVDLLLRNLAILWIL